MRRVPLKKKIQKVQILERWKTEPGREFQLNKVQSVEYGKKKTEKGK